MGKEPDEVTARELLKQCRAVLVRISGNGHEVWRLPNGRVWVMPRSGRHAGPRVWNHNLRNLKRLLGEAL